MTVWDSVRLGVDAPGFVCLECVRVAVWQLRVCFEREICWLGLGILGLFRARVVGKRAESRGRKGRKKIKNPGRQKKRAWRR